MARKALDHLHDVLEAIDAIVWSVVENELPKLRKAVARIARLPPG